MGGPVETDSLTPGERVPGPVPGTVCGRCAAGDHQSCHVAVCRGCGCRRRPVLGWPHGEAT